jgi:hypothetical protein
MNVKSQKRSDNMRILGATILLTAFTFGGCKHTNGIDEASALKIMHGIEVQPGEFKQTVLLAFKSGQVCSGVVIGNDTVLTASHCVIKDLLGASALVFTDERVTPELYKNKEVVGKPSENTILPQHLLDNKTNFKKISFANLRNMARDLAVVHFAKNTFTQDQIVTLTTEPVSKEGGYKIVGYGQSTPIKSVTGYRTMGVKRVAEVPKVRHDGKVIRFISRMQRSAKTVFPGPAQGDSGGPLLRLNETSEEYELAGIFSGVFKTPNFSRNGGSYHSVYVDVQSDFAKDFFEQVRSLGADIGQ